MSIYERVVNNKIELIKQGIEPTTLFINKKENQEIESFFRENLLPHNEIVYFCGLKMFIVDELESFKIGI